MYSIIFALDELVLQEEQTGQLRRLGCSWVDNCTGMRRYNGKVPYIAIAPSIEVIHIVLWFLSQLDHPQIIGIWGEDWLQQWYKKEVILSEDWEIVSESIIRNDEEIVSPFNQSLYMDFLDDIVSYDDYGNETGRSRPATPTQVVNWAWWKNRNLL